MPTETEPSFSVFIAQLADRTCEAPLRQAALERLASATDVELPDLFSKHLPTFLSLLDADESRPLGQMLFDRYFSRFTQLARQGTIPIAFGDGLLAYLDHPRAVHSARTVPIVHLYLDHLIAHDQFEAHHFQWLVAQLNHSHTLFRNSCQMMFDPSRGLSTRFYALHRKKTWRTTDLSGFIETFPVSAESKTTLLRMACQSQWFNSPFRWRELFTLSTLLWNDGGLRTHLNTLCSQSAGDARFIGDLSSFISSVTALNPRERAIWVEEAKVVISARSLSEMKILFDELGHKLSIAEHPIYLQARTKLFDAASGYAYFAWLQLNGHWQTLAMAREVVGQTPDPKPVLNLLEHQVIKAPLPSRAAIEEKRASSIKDRQFLKRLGSASYDDPALLQDDLSKIEWMMASPEWETFRQNHLYDLLLRASTFMSPRGLSCITDLLAQGRIENGRLTYPRYTQLAGIFHPLFLKVRGMDYYQALPLSSEDHLEVLKIQTKDKIRERLASLDKRTASNDSPADHWGHLPIHLQTWLDSGLDSHQARTLWNNFQEHEADIYRHFGIGFSDISSILKNYIVGLDQGVLNASYSQAIYVTGDLEMVARAGQEPVHTCQTFEYLRDENTNLDGQPVNRLRHGQFQVAYLMMDGERVARRAIETTLDNQGRACLHVEAESQHRYGFGGEDKFYRAIVDYARKLAIPEERIFTQKPCPAPIDPGDPIYYVILGTQIDDIKPKQIAQLTQQNLSADDIITLQNTLETLSPKSISPLNRILENMIFGYKGGREWLSPEKGLNALRQMGTTPDAIRLAIQEKVLRMVEMSQRDRAVEILTGLPNSSLWSESSQPTHEVSASTLSFLGTGAIGPVLHHWREGLATSPIGPYLDAPNPICRLAHTGALSEKSLSHIEHGASGLRMGLGTLLYEESVGRLLGREASTATILVDTTLMLGAGIVASAVVGGILANPVSLVGHFASTALTFGLHRLANGALHGNLHLSWQDAGQAMAGITMGGLVESAATAYLGIEGQTLSAILKTAPTISRALGEGLAFTGRSTLASFVGSAGNDITALGQAAYKLLTTPANHATPYTPSPPLPLSPWHSAEPLARAAEGLFRPFA